MEFLIKYIYLIGDHLIYNLDISLEVRLIFIIIIMINFVYVFMILSFVVVHIIWTFVSLKKKILKKIKYMNKKKIK